MSKYWRQRDCLWIEIPIERNPSLCDKTIHSEILIARKNEVTTIIKGMPHVEKILTTINPMNSLHWDSKGTLQVLGENLESIENLFYDDRISSSLMANQDLIYAIHVTDQRLYNKFDLCMKVQLKITSKNVRDKVKWAGFLKDIMYIADYLSKMRVSQQVQIDTLQRRKKLLHASNVAKIKKK